MSDATGWSAHTTSCSVPHRTGGRPSPASHCGMGSLTRDDSPPPTDDDSGSLHPRRFDADLSHIVRFDATDACPTVGRLCARPRRGAAMLRLPSALRWCGALLAVAALVLTACGGPPTDETTRPTISSTNPYGGDPATEGTPKRGGTARIGMDREAVSFD